MYLWIITVNSGEYVGGGDVEDSATMAEGVSDKSSSGRGDDM